MENIESNQQGLKINAEDVLAGLRNKLSSEIQNGITMEIVIGMKEREIQDLKLELEELRETVQELKNSKG